MIDMSSNINLAEIRVYNHMNIWRDYWGKFHLFIGVEIIK